MEKLIIEKTGINRMALRGSVALVTGAGQGIGRETARILAYLGAAVAIAEIKDTGLETEQLIRAEDGRALFIKTDVSDPSSMELLRRQVLEAFGEVDLLVNNAAFYTTSPLLELSVEEWDRVFAVNLRGAFLGVKAFLPAMLQRGKGVIVTMESAEGMPYLAPYLASKAGLRSLAMSLAQEVGEESGVAVYCFGPGLVETPGQLGASRELAPRYGLSLEEFYRQAGLRPISAELCATGLVGTILHAREFHGQETGYVAGLSKLGLDPEGKRWPTRAQEEIVDTPDTHDTPDTPHDPHAAAPADPPGETPGLYQEAIVLNRKMEEILRANIREYEELTMFQRPFVKRMFQQGTGLTVEDWLADAEQMTQQLKSTVKTGADPKAFVGPRRLRTYIAQLQRMVAFITKQESDARGWIKDSGKLKVALAALQERKETARRLASVLPRIEQENLV